MSSFKHDRILSPVAIFIDSVNQMPSIVLPIMANGDLCRYLRKNKVFPIVKLITFARQIAEGKAQPPLAKPWQSIHLTINQIYN